MMWLVRMALKRPYTFVVMSMLIVILGVVTILRMPTDIFPDIDIPVISVVWNYPGLPPEEMEKRIVTNYERGLTTTVNDIEHIESQSLTGISVIKIFFQPGAKIEAATAQVTAISQTVLRQMPPGTTPPVHHPLQRVERPHPPGRARERLAQRAAALRLRDELHPRRHRHHPGRADALAVRRQAAADHDRHRSRRGSSPGGSRRATSTTRIGLQNVIVPTGTAKIGADEYPIVLNSSPELLDEIAGIPIKVVHGTTVYVRDVANVRDGYAPQTNIVHVSGKKSVLMSILKQGSASTLDVVKRIRDILPTTLVAGSPRSSRSRSLFDQSIFVRAAVQGVVKEAGIAAGADGADAPALPRELAEHAHRRSSRSRSRSSCRSSSWRGSARRSTS